MAKATLRPKLAAMPASYDPSDLSLLTRRGDELTHPAIDPLSLSEHCPLDNSRLEKLPSYDRPITSTFGTLEALPLELIHGILLHLDIASLTTLRRVSRHVRELIDQLPPYRRIYAQAPQVLRACLSTGISPWTILGDLYATLTSSKCGTCDQFGPYLHLLTTTRACHDCVSGRPEFLPWSSVIVKVALGIEASTVASLPTITSIPGCYSESYEPVQRESFVSLAAAVVNDDKMVAALPDLNSRITASLDKKHANPLRFIGVLQVPWFDVANGTAEWGILCNGCECSGTFHIEKQERQIAVWTLYTKAGFAEHFKKCRRAQLMSRYRTDFGNMLVVP